MKGAMQESVTKNHDERRGNRQQNDHRGSRAANGVGEDEQSRRRQNPRQRKQRAQEVNAGTDNDGRSSDPGSLIHQRVTQPCMYFQLRGLLSAIHPTAVAKRLARVAPCFASSSHSTYSRR